MQSNNQSSMQSTGTGVRQRPTRPTRKEKKTESNKAKGSKEMHMNAKLDKIEWMFARYSQKQKGNPWKINKQLMSIIKQMESYGFDVEDYTEWEGYQDVIDALGKRRLEDFALQN